MKIDPLKLFESVTPSKALVDCLGVRLAQFKNHWPW